MLRQILVRHHLVLFLAVLYAGYSAVLFGVADVHDPARASHSVLRLASPLVELGLAAMIYVAFLRVAQRRQRIVWLIPAWLLLAAVAIIYVAQSYSLYISRNFITVLALQNSDSAAFVASKRLLVVLLAAAAGIAAFIGASVMAARSPCSTSKAKPGAYATVFHAGLAFLLVLFSWLLTLQDNDQRLEAGFRQSPVASLMVNVVRASRPDREFGLGGAVPASELQCFSFSAKAASHDYPFLRRRAFVGAPPFSTAPDSPDEKPNVIVIFTEGLSARLIGSYGGKYPGLTPNIDRLAAEAMQVNDYFNHTAATYRGLGGQLSSGFPFAGGGGKEGWIHKENQGALLDMRRRTLPEILGEAGYESYFFAPHRKNRPIIGMLGALGFDTVYTFESIQNKFLDGAANERLGTGGIDDQSVFSGLVSFLEDRDRNGNEVPFFSAAYNIGTHAFLDTSPDDVAYGEGHNTVLNKVHNYDAAFGKFLDYFLASPFADNTVLIFTSDHATYPEPAYREVAGSNFKPYFVDRIPLLVRDPYHSLPAQWNAEARTSLDLAPTTLQLLGVESGENAFLGTSLFAERNFPLGMAALGSSFYFTTVDGVSASKEVPASLQEVARCQMDVVRRYFQAERDNRLVAPGG